MHRVLADFSRWANRRLGGAENTTLCHRAAMRWGWDCVFCRVVGRIMRQPTHCLEECEAHEIVALKRRRK